MECLVDFCEIGTAMEIWPWLVLRFIPAAIPFPFPILYFRDFKDFIFILTYYEILHFYFYIFVHFNCINGSKINLLTYLSTIIRNTVLYIQYSSQNTISPSHYVTKSIELILPTFK